MKRFEFYFDGTPNSDGSMNAGIRKLSGDPVDIALMLGTYASEALKKGEHQAAIIVVNAFKRFMEVNPDMGEKILSALEFRDGVKIIQSPGIIKPFRKK
jgi:hypothetical protein